MSIELLAPAGNMNCLYAAVQNGADAVYIGGKDFNARQYADNFDREQLVDAVQYCHIRGVRVYVTINTLLSDTELKEIVDYLLFLYNADVDALIVQDLGLIWLIRSLLPDFELHASTQMTVHNLYGARFLEKLGFKRVILSREMSLQEIEHITRNSGIETEIFGHGALCFSYSGQCLMSSFIGSRSGNRGKCAQPCRLEYSLLENGKEISFPFKHLLSTKDLNTSEILPEIIKSGIRSLKIEGRMKKPEYVATVVRVYKKILTSSPSDETDKKDLIKIFNRQFTTAYLKNPLNSVVAPERPDNRGIYIGKILCVSEKIQVKLEDNLSVGDGIRNTGKENNGWTVREILSDKGKTDSASKGETVWINFDGNPKTEDHLYKTSDSLLLKNAAASFQQDTRKIELKGFFKARINDKIFFIVEDDFGNNIFCDSQETVQKALKTATSKERILQQLNKCGNTPFVFKNIYLECDNEISVPISSINEIRRTALEKITELRKNFNRRDALKTLNSDILNIDFIYDDSLPSLTASVYSEEQLKASIDEGITRIYSYDLNLYKKYFSEAVKKGVQLIPALVRITQDEEIQKIKEILDSKELLIGNIGHIAAFGDKKISCDFSMNVFNTAGISFLRENGASMITLSPEMDIKQINKTAKHFNGLEVIVYGRMPLMISKHCVINRVKNMSTRKCGLCKSADYSLKDRINTVFPIITDSACRMTVLNSVALCAIQFISELKPKYLRIFLTNENYSQSTEIIKAFKNAVSGKDFSDFSQKIQKEGFTKGHFFREV